MHPKSFVSNFWGAVQRSPGHYFYNIYFKDPYTEIAKLQKTHLMASSNPLEVTSTRSRLLVHQVDKT
ncbi:MAG TPA: hypothetical protein PLT34_07200, partial [Muribaculaceae bacterium]|nr:hypothetical protein [Muribaculaceae bacterium]